MDAKKLDVGEGDLVVVYNDYGEGLFKAFSNVDVSERVVWTPRQLKGLYGTPLNALFTTRVQEIGGGPAFNSVRIW